MWKPESVLRPPPELRCPADPGADTHPFAIRPADQTTLRTFLLTNSQLGFTESTPVPTHGMQLSRMTVCGLVLRPGDVFLAQPVGSLRDPEEMMFFGRVVRLLKLQNPASRAGDPPHPGHDVDMVMVEWLSAAPYGAHPRVWRGKQLDAELLCPVVDAAPRKVPDGPWWFANSIVPWACWALEHPTKKDKLAILARHWHVLRHLRPYPFIQLGR
jgi:hypothetical protein